MTEAVALPQRPVPLMRPADEWAELRYTEHGPEGARPGAGERGRQQAALLLVGRAPQHQHAVAAEQRPERDHERPRSGPQREPALGVGAGPLSRGLQGGLGVWRTETRLHVLVRALPVAPRWALRWVLGATLAAQGPREDELIEELLETPGQLKRLTGLLRCLGPLAPRLPGWENDRQQQATLHHTALEAIVAPVLIVHGVLDPIVPLEHATRVAHRAPKAELMLLDRAGHLGGIVLGVRHHCVDERRGDRLR